VNEVNEVFDPATEIRDAWRSVAGSDHDSVADELVTRHAEPHRHYHTAAHVARVLHHVGRLLVIHGQGVDRDAVVAAALFHDAIYDPRSSTNEADSARLAADHLGRLGWDDTRIAEVATLIEATVGHSATTPAAAVLLDADLAVLGGAPESYGRYVAGVRAEYSFVSDDAWRAGRAAVLRSFLDRSHIFATDAMAGECEQQARRNMAAELAGLQSPAP
jgi:predicted metal-dependent HD superfamily phosphohydrolase